MNWYKLATKWKDKLKGGLADNKTPDDFDKKQVNQGIKVEKEHTDDEHLAEEISLDHLSEDPLYYEKLKTMEKRFAKKYNVLDTQLLCCQFPKNRRKNPYKKNKKENK